MDIRDWVSCCEIMEVLVRKMDWVMSLVREGWEGEVRRGGSRMWFC